MPRLLSIALALALAACDAESGSNPPPAAPQAAAPESRSGSAQRGLIRDFAETPAPDIAFETAPGGAEQTIAGVIAANPGKPVLVNLWATWCAPCLKELPTLDALAADAGDRLIVLPISQDMEGWRKVSPAFTTEKYPNLATMLESQTLIGAAMQAQGLPLTILYDASGKEVWRYAGDRDWNSAESRAMIGI